MLLQGYYIICEVVQYYLMVDCDKLSIVNPKATSTTKIRYMANMPIVDIKKKY